LPKSRINIHTELRRACVEIQSHLIEVFVDIFVARGGGLIRYVNWLLPDQSDSVLCS